MNLFRNISKLYLYCIRIKFEENISVKTHLERLQNYYFLSCLLGLRPVIAENIIKFRLVFFKSFAAFAQRFGQLLILKSCKDNVMIEKSIEPLL